MKNEIEIMSEETPFDATVEQKVLQARLDEIKRYEKRESRALVFFQTTLVSILAIFVVVQYFNSSTLLDFISNAETNLDKSLATADGKLKNALDKVDARLASALNDTEPQRAKLEPLYSDYDGYTLVYDAHVASWDDNSQRYYTVKMTAFFYTSIEGPPGRLAGMMSKYSGPIIKYSGKTRLGEFDKTVNLIFNKGKFSPESSDNGNSGMFITKYGPLLSRALISIPATSCKNAVALVDEMADRKDLGKVYLKPVFARIQSPPDFQEFSIRVRSRLYHSCEELELGRKNNS